MPGNIPSMMSVYSSKDPLDLNAMNRGKKYGSNISDDEMIEALNNLFNDCAPDLGVDDTKDDAFQYFARDRLADFGVPKEKIVSLLRDLEKPRRSRR